MYRNVWSVDIGDHSRNPQQHYLTATSHLATTETDDTKKLLKRLCRLLEHRARREEEQQHDDEKQRCRDDKETKMRNDWILAAAVLDRTCAVVVTVIFVVGIVVSFVVFFNHP